MKYSIALSVIYAVPLQSSYADQSGAARLRALKGPKATKGPKSSKAPKTTRKPKSTNPPPKSTDNCEPVANLGSTNVDRYDYSLSMDVDDQCAYSLSFQMKHDPNLPVATDPFSQCDPSIAPPAIASDGLPYFALRWAWESVPAYVKKATGIDHISVDFNPCGHPPFGVFTVPHYDFHIYLVDPDYRSCMTCDKIPGTPICNPEAQTTPNGKGFFNVNTIISGPDAGKPANMPDGFHVGIGDFVPLMGGHAWDMENQPNAAAGKPWVDPVWVMGPYDGTIVDYEPMIPLSFMTGTGDKYYEESLTYVGQSINALPTKFSASYDGTSGYLTVTMEGQSDGC
mmetsp:Transcript_2103/g.3094  ORF Transcript_2103/g.3094 Transcript_2103/m.3094 type:complete len:340 (-) Transcript_2103:195-1214(-)